MFSATWTKSFLTVIVSVRIKKLYSLPTHRRLLGTSCPLWITALITNKGYDFWISACGHCWQVSWAHMGAPHTRGLCEHLELNFQEWPQWWDSKLSIYILVALAKHLSSSKEYLQQSVYENVLQHCQRPLILLSHVILQGILWIIHSFAPAFSHQFTHTIIWACFLQGLCTCCPASCTLFSQVPTESLLHFYLLLPQAIPLPSAFSITSPALFSFSHYLTNVLCLFMFSHGPGLHLFCSLE